MDLVKNINTIEFLEETERKLENDVRNLKKKCNEKLQIRR
jgi:hypothetical protein